MISTDYYLHNVQHFFSIGAAVIKVKAFLPFFSPSLCCLLAVVGFFFLDRVTLFWLCPWTLAACLAMSVWPDTEITITWSKARTENAQARDGDWVPGSSMFRNNYSLNFQGTYVFWTKEKQNPDYYLGVDPLLIFPCQMEFAILPNGWRQQDRFLKMQ